MASYKLMSLLQAALALFGMVWKRQEGFALFDVANQLHYSDSAGKESEQQDLSLCLRELTGVSLAALRDNWPWFSLHLFLYIGQLVPLIVMTALVQPPQGNLRRPLGSLGAVATLGILSWLCGFSTAMPVVSVYTLYTRQHMRRRNKSNPLRRALLGSLLLFSAATHIGAFSVSLAATSAPSLFAPEASRPLHLTNSLLGVPASARVNLPGVLVRQARLRHIKEMTGTSSGFFLTAALPWRALESRGRRVSRELLLWMFLVSLIAGPAAGGAAVLLLEEFLAVDEGRLNEGVKTR